MPERALPEAVAAPTLAGGPACCVARVLVIDDDPGVSRCIQRMLRRHDVRVASSASEALPSLLEGPLPDLVLCDLMMPGFSGMELFAQLQRVRLEALERFVFMSGGGFGREADAFLVAHPELPLIEKPFSAGQLEALAARAAARRPR